MNDGELRTQRVGPVGWVILGAAPPDELRRAWRRLDDDPAVRVIVTTGDGDIFGLGPDPVDTAGAGAGDDAWSTTSRQLGKPVIAAVNGLCLGRALTVVADADLVIASSDAAFGDPGVSTGGALSPGTIGLLHKMSAEAVFRMAYLGEYGYLSAQRAFELGLVGEIVDPPSRLREAAQTLGEMIAGNSPAALRASKRALWGAFEMGLSDACRAGAAHLAGLWGHPDQVEGPAAFAERRPPRWEEI